MIYLEPTGDRTSEHSLYEYTPNIHGTDNLEIRRLLDLIPTATTAGTTLLANNMTDRPLPVAFAIARQEATEELKAHPDTLEEVRTALTKFAEDEEKLNELFSATITGRNPRIAYRHGRAALATMVEIANDLPVFESPLLTTVKNELQAYSQSPEASYTKGKVYLTPNGLKPHDSAWKWAVPLRTSYRGYPFTGRFAALSAVALVYTKYFADAKQGDISAATTLSTTPAAEQIDSLRFGLTMLPLLGTMIGVYGNFSGDVPHRSMYIQPLRKKLQDSHTLGGARRAFAELDILQAFASVQDTITSHGYAYTYPNFDTKSTHHYFSATDLRPPLLALDKTGKPAVSNEFAVHGLTFLTGPNSGGKSTTVKSLLQSQLLGQVGCALPASSATLVRADHIDYMTPGAPEQEEGIGRFGHELTELRDIFHRFGRLSFIGLDDCMDGTTHAERLVVLGDIMHALHSIGGTALFSTHATELVQEFADRSIGEQWQVEFEDNNPTHKIITGVSHTSHAARVAKQVGMDKNAINASLEKRGYKKI